MVKLFTAFDKNTTNEEPVSDGETAPINTD